jgi:hypothetical protein
VEARLDTAKGRAERVAQAVEKKKKRAILAIFKV